MMGNHAAHIVAFYSYKGGVGRSLALANTGVKLAMRGHRVLLVDLDLEAPGLHDIHPFRNAAVPASGGLLELLNLYKQGGDQEASFPDWQLETYATPVWPNLSAPATHAVRETETGAVWLMPASGRVWPHATQTDSCQSYEALLSSFKWSDFYDQAGDAAWANFLTRITGKPGGYGFDFVLLDSRTGLSDPFYVALTMASDVVVVSGFNRQNIKGARNVMRQVAQPTFLAEYGRKRVHLVGSPAPDLDNEQWLRWESAVKASSVWPEFPGFLARLPYFKEFALDERVVVDEGDKNLLTQQREYIQNIDLLADAVMHAGNQEPPTVAAVPEPTNPFSLLRADYASIEELNHYFIDPGKELLRAMKTFKPVVMAGARGCGKTMLGRYFSFEREATELKERSTPATPVSAPEYLGLYLRIDIDLLQIFNPPTEGERHLYNTLFGQFFDLLVFRKVLDALETFGGLAAWCGGQAGETVVYKTLLREFGPHGKDVPPVGTKMQELIKEMLAEMRRYVNNPRTEPEPFKLQSNILLKLLVEELTSHADGEFHRHYFAVIVDEYEHFSEAQQKVVNSRIKQIKQSDHTTYRIFVKHGKAGLHTTATLAESQQIQPVHDFNRINLDEDIETGEFAAQMHRIAERYLLLCPYFKSLGVQTLDQLFDSEGADEQARRIAKDDRKLRDWVKKHFTLKAEDILRWFDEEPRLLTKVVAVVIMNQGVRRNASLLKTKIGEKSPEGVLREFRARSAKTQDWLHNYERGSLFWWANLHARPKDLVYAGSDMVITLAGRNVRTFLELCRAIVEGWLALGKDGQHPLPPIAVDTQTTAVRRAAENYRGVIRSLPVHSRELLKLADRLGHLFSVLAKSSTQSEPEINHFSIARDTAHEPWNELFETAYAESILLRRNGNKQKSDSNLEQDDWQLNPCFAPHYGYSPRRKKKLGALSGRQMEILLTGSDDEFNQLRMQFQKRLGDNEADSEQPSLFISTGRR